MTSALLGWSLKTYPFAKSGSYSVENRNKDMSEKQAKDIHNSSHGPNNILSQVPPESRPD